MQAKIQGSEKNITNSTINSMLDILNTVLKKDNTLANELLSFLNQHNVEVPILSSNELKELIPVSYSQKNPHKQMRKLKSSFEGIQAEEFIL